MIAARTPRRAAMNNATPRIDPEIDERSAA
jgi:hypothetical protein